MLINDFEKKIQSEIDSDLNIRTNKNSDDIAGIYLGDHYIGVSVPPKEIFEEKNGGYKDSVGHTYRTIGEALEIIPPKIAKTRRNIEEEIQFKKDHPNFKMN